MSALGNERQGGHLWKRPEGTGRVCWDLLRKDWGCMACWCRKNSPPWRTSSPGNAPSAKSVVSSQWLVVLEVGDRWSAAKEQRATNN
ncbi:MAG: hypothetical protein EBE86_020590 [Hormoscilla sp. GUM202]|nr:hypothetical protein [Hormoscilla sp. GUM202]